MPRRLKLSLKRDEALWATRVSIKNKKLVYILVADKRLKYGNSKSRIAYIGTTKNGIARIAQSVAYRSDEIFKLRGVRTFHARVVSCNPRRKVKTWKKLERALLLKFREMYGEIPKCNSQGKNMKLKNEFRYFGKTGVKNVIEELS